MKKERIYFVILGLIFAVSFLWLLKSLFLGFYPDFAGYYYGAKLMLQGQNPYLGGEGLHTTYVYPPVVLAIFTPFLFFHFLTASVIWTVLNIIFLVLSLYMLSKTFEMKFFSLANLTLMTLVFLSFPTKFTLGMGQINMLILFLLTITLWFLKQKKEFVAGIFLGASIAIKLFPLFLPIYLLIKFKKGDRGFLLPWTRLRVWFSKKQLKNDIEMLDGLVLVAVAAIIITLIFVPQELYKEFLFNTLPSFFTSWKLDYYNQALSGFVGRSFGSGEFGSGIKFTLSLVITVITLFIVTKNEDESFSAEALKFGTLIILSLIANNFSWQHHFVWLVIPVYATFSYLQKFKFSKKYFFFLLTSYFLVSINLKEATIHPTLLQSHVFYGAIILLSLNIFLLRRKL